MNMRFPCGVLAVFLILCALIGGLAAGMHEPKPWSKPTFLRLPREHTGSVTSLSFSPDMKRLASGARDKDVLIWDVAKGEVAQRLSAHDRIEKNFAAFCGRNGDL